MSTLPIHRRFHNICSLDDRPIERVLDRAAARGLHGVAALLDDIGRELGGDAGREIRAILERYAINEPPLLGAIEYRR